MNQRGCFPQEQSAASQLTACILLRGLSLSLRKLNNGMVIGPRDFEPLSQLFYGLDALRSPYDKTRCRGTKSSNHPAKSLHSESPPVFVLNAL